MVALTQGDTNDLNSLENSMKCTLEDRKDTKTMEIPFRLVLPIQTLSKYIKSSFSGFVSVMMEIRSLK